MKKERSVVFDDNVEYVVEQLDVKDPALEAFSDIFAKFQARTDFSEVRLHILRLFENTKLTSYSPCAGQEFRA